MNDKTTPGQPLAAGPADAFGAALGGMLKSMQGLSLPLPQLAQIQSDYVKQATEVWNQSLQRLQPPAAPADQPA